jgi:hypothetical protein
MRPFEPLVASYAAACCRAALIAVLAATATAAAPADRPRNWPGVISPSPPRSSRGTRTLEADGRDNRCGSRSVGGWIESVDAAGLRPLLHLFHSTHRLKVRA